MTDRRKQALIEMAKRGTFEEQEIAKDIIERSGIAIENEKTIQAEFKFTNKYERNLIHQIHGMIINSQKGNYYSSKKKPKTIWYDLTINQEREMRLIYLIYKRELKEEIQITYEAFVQKNNIFPQCDIDNPKERKDIDRIKKILNRSNTIDKTHIRKQLEAF